MECDGALELGAEVSAKFRGAYCEAVVKKVVNPQLEVRVRFDNSDYGVHTLLSRVSLCACVCMLVCVRVRVGGWVCVCVCARVSACVYRVDSSLCVVAG